MRVLLTFTASVEATGKDGMYLAKTEVTYLEENNVKCTNTRSCMFATQEEALFFTAEQHATIRQGL